MVDPESGKTQMTLTTERPSTPRLYIGRTRESRPAAPQALPRPDSCYPSRVLASQSVCASANPSRSTKQGYAAVAKTDLVSAFVMLKDSGLQAGG